MARGGIQTTPSKHSGFGLGDDEIDACGVINLSNDQIHLSTLFYGLCRRALSHKIDLDSTNGSKIVEFAT